MYTVVPQPKNLIETFLFKSIYKKKAVLNNLN
jgi:hypothetical protein